MTKEETKRNKNPIITVCAVVVAVILLAVVVAILLFSSNKKIDDSYFVSDGTKYVFTTESNDLLGLDLGEYVPEKTHLVYYYSGNKVTDLKYYYVYGDETTAKNAVEYIKEANQDAGVFKEVAANGKYVVITADPSLYEEMTAEDAQQQIEFLEMLQEISTGEMIEEEEEEEEVDEEEDEIINEAEEEAAEEEEEEEELEY